MVVNKSKVIVHYDRNKFETALNEFIADKNIVDIRYHTFSGYDDDTFRTMIHHSALVIYEEKEK